MVDADVAQAFAGGLIPSNLSYITPEYLDQKRDAPAIIAIIIITIVTTLIVLLRSLSRIFLVKSFGLDDWIALLSYACFLTFVAICFILINEGSGRHIEYIQYVLTHEQTDRTEVFDYAAHLIYTFALFICRLSGLSFFHRLCAFHEPLRKAIIMAAVFLVCAFLPQFFLILAHCSPVTGLWPYPWSPDIYDYKCLTWGTVYVTNSGLSLVCDFVLFSIPIAMISLLKLSSGKKIMLVFVLMPGVMVTGISIARLYLCVVGQWATDGSWYYDPQLAIEVAEIGGTLIALSIPGLKPLFGLWYEKFRSTAGSTFRRTENADPERLGYERKISEAGQSKRKSAWDKDVFYDRGNVRTHVSADKTMNDNITTLARGSSSTSEEELVNSRDIMVQMEVDQRSIPLRPLGDSQSMQK